MADLALRAMLQALLGGSSVEDTFLLQELARRIILSGVAINSSGVWSLGLPTFAPSTIANLGTGTIGDLPYFDAASTLAKISDVATGKALTSGGVGAAPAYTTITNSHIDAAAAIAYSKLNLALSILNSDVNAAAAIAYSKLNLALSIVNADINAAAAIAWTKLDKTGSSLADLTTKSAAALTSGLLPDARLPGYTSDGASRIEQLAFLAAQVASSDANTLDDYEEGTWTPVLGGTGGTSGQTYSRQVGEYVKIGKQVTAFFTVQFSTKGTITTAAQIQGLPFTVENTSNYFGSVAFTYWDNLAVAKSSIGGLCNAGATTADVWCVAATPGVSMVQLVTADIANTSQFVGAVTYRATA